MNVKQTHDFERALKKLPKQQKAELDQAVKAVIDNPQIGEQKKGDLAGVRVYKFKMNKQLTLLAYTYEADTVTLYLLKLGSHENFYRDLKISARVLAPMLITGAMVCSGGGAIQDARAEGVEGPPVVVDMRAPSSKPKALAALKKVAGAVNMAPRKGDELPAT